MIIVLNNGMLCGMARRIDDRWQGLALAAVSASRRRVGGAKRAVVQVLAGEHCCVSAHEIAEGARESGDRIGIASVYRALEQLEAEGLVQRVELGEGGARYETVVPGGEHHHHAICERCGRLTPFEDGRLERAIVGLTERLGHSVRAHDVLIRGECETCAGGR
jgi:Fur family ferric uptake transcriptional regulator